MEHERLDEFRREVDRVKVSGGRIEVERWAAVGGVVLFVAAVVIEIIAFSASSSAEDPREQTDMVILALLGVVLALGSVGLFIRYSITRWFRHWLIRLIYEDRQQTDRIVSALGSEPPGPE